MNRITDFAETEYIVPYGTRLPAEIKQYLSCCIGVHVIDMNTGRLGTKYIIPRYLMTQWLAKYDPSAISGTASKKESND